jgi:biopolymer transport protein ExbD
MRRRPIHLPHPAGKINVTPMIDVVMCLIVFYLIVGKLAADQRSAIRLPASTTGATDKAQDQLIINVMPGPIPGATRIVIDAFDVPDGMLEATIKDRVAAKPDVVVEVRGSRELSYSSVAMVVRACKSAGVASVRLATERAPGVAGPGGGL